MLIAALCSQCACLTFSTLVAVYVAWCMSGNVRRGTVGWQYVMPESYSHFKWGRMRCAAALSCVNGARYGPIITDNGVHDAGGFTLVLKWVSVDPSINDTTYEAFYRLNNNATDWDSFQVSQWLVRVVICLGVRLMHAQCRTTVPADSSLRHTGPSRTL
jgi:hypothetical protein